MKDWQLGMKARTSPSVAGLGGGGFQASFQANTGNLWTVGTAGMKDWQLGLKAQTSPCITGAFGGSCAPGATDFTAPTVGVGAVSRFRLASSVSVPVSATDAGAGVSSSDVRWRAAKFNGDFGAYQLPTEWQGITATSVTKSSLAKGYTYCFSVRARDKAGNVSGWSGDKCTTVALDDRSLSGSGWTEKTHSDSYAGTYKTTTTKGRYLSITNGQAARVAVVATTCAGCGEVGVYVDGTLVGKVNLYSATTKRAQVLTLPAFALKAGTVTVKVLSSDKTIQVDGLAITRV
jgi:hypothetical protein